MFSGITVAVSLAALIALPVPFLRSVGFTGLLIPCSPRCRWWWPGPD